MDDRPYENKRMSYREQKLAAAGRRMKAAKRAALAEHHPDPEYTLDDVTFASAAARDLAAEHGLTFYDFAKSPVTPSGITGFVTDDVRRVLEERDG